MLGILIVILVSACIITPVKIFIHYCEKLTPEIVAEKLWVWAEHVILGVPVLTDEEGCVVDITKC